MSVYDIIFIRYKLTCMDISARKDIGLIYKILEW